MQYHAAYATVAVGVESIPTGVESISRPSLGENETEEIGVESICRSTLEEPAGVESTTSGVESISRPTFEESDFTKGVEGLMVPLPNQGGMLE